MKLYQAFATDLNHLLNGARAVRITVPGYMPLSVEEIGSVETDTDWCPSAITANRTAISCVIPIIVFLFH